MNQRGQFFLMAAIIIAGILFGITSITNVARGGSEQRAFYDLSEEVNFETKRVLDYGVYNEKDLDSLLEGFLIEYADYIAQEKVLFVFGNKDSVNLTGIFFNSNGAIGSQGISTGGVATIIPIHAISQEVANVTVIDHNKVSVEIDEVKYYFNLRSGENFFFVIMKEENDGTFVATG